MMALCKTLQKAASAVLKLDAKIIKPIVLHMSLDPKNVANSVAPLVNNALSALKSTFIDPLTPHIAQMKQDESKIKSAAQSFASLKIPPEVTKAQAAAKDAQDRIVHLTEQQLKLADVAKGAQKTLQDIQNKTYDDLLKHVDEKAATNLIVTEKRELRLFRDEIIRKKLELNASTKI